MSATGAALRGEGLRRTRKRSGFVLDIPRIEVGAGQTLAILGPSGSGKSTLLELLGLLERPDEGTLFFDGRPADVHDRAIRLQMAAVFQRPYLFKGSVNANVEYGLAARGVVSRERRIRAEAALERVGLGGYGGRSAASLSGGEAQRVSLARALVLEPRVLLLDEPLASLDRLLRRRLINDFATILADSGVTVVYVTHDKDEALIVADHIAVMNSGRIVANGATDEIAGLSADPWTADFLGVEQAMTGIVRSSSEGLVEIVVGAMTLIGSGSARVGSHALVAVPPEDVLLFADGAALPLTTARNRIKATVSGIEPRGATMRVTLAAGDSRMASTVSRAACADLRLREGSAVLAVFKANAVRWRMLDEGDTT